MKIFTYFTKKKILATAKTIHIKIMYLLYLSIFFANTVISWY